MAEINFDKYRSQREQQPASGGPQTTPEALPLPRTPPHVLRLAEYLGDNEDGYILYRKDGCIGVRFNPPIKSITKQPERYERASFLCDLLIAAAPHINRMIALRRDLPQQIKDAFIRGRQ